MVNRALWKRIEAVEQQRGIGREPDPTIFIGITDSSLPDPDAPELAAVEYSDAMTIGVKPSVQGPAVLRLPGESVKAMQRRASALLPDCRVFFTLYANDPRTGDPWLNGTARL